MKYVILVKEEITCETPCNDRGGRIAGTGELLESLAPPPFRLYVQDSDVEIGGSGALRLLFP